MGEHEAEAVAHSCNIDGAKPAVFFGNNRVVTDPTPAKVAPILGLDIAVEQDRVFDVLIVGGGNSAGQAAMFLCRTARLVMHSDLLHLRITRRMALIR